jgi:hypothetical protein
VSEPAPPYNVEAGRCRVVSRTTPGLSGKATHPASLLGFKNISGSTGSIRRGNGAYAASGARPFVFSRVCHRWDDFGSGGATARIPWCFTRRQRPLISQAIRLMGHQRGIIGVHCHRGLCRIEETDWVRAQWLLLAQESQGRTCTIAQGSIVNGLVWPIGLVRRSRQWTVRRIQARPAAAVRHRAT